MNKTPHVLVALVVSAARLSSAQAGTEDATCKLLFEATAKSLTLPYHMYMKTSLPNVNGGKPAASEFINTGRARYRKQDDGTWVPASSPQDELDQMADNRKENQYTCRFIRDESIDGIAASLYEFTSDSGLITKTWLSKSDGLPVHVVIGTGGVGFEERFVYGPVTAPPVK